MIRTTCRTALATTASLLALALPGCGAPPGDEGVAAEGEALSAPIAIANESPTALTSSTGNLYWASREVVSGAFVATFYRGSKQQTPGQEGVLYQERAASTGSIDINVESVVWAQVNGVYYGYLLFLYRRPAGTLWCAVKRVPLAGGAAETIATGTGFGYDLRTDGTALYWWDGAGVHRSGMAPGGPTTLLHASEGVSALAISSSSVVFAETPSASTSGYTISTMPKSGGGSRGLVATSSQVETLYVDSPSNSLFWGEQNTAVHSIPLSGGVIRTYQSPIGYSGGVSAIGVAGSRVLWTSCDTKGCTMRAQYGTGPVMTLVSSQSEFEHDALEWDSAAVYYGVSAGGGLKKILF